MSLGARLIGRARGLMRSSTLRLTLLLSLVFALGMTAAVWLSLAFGQDALLRRTDATLTGLAQLVEAGEVTEESGQTILRRADRVMALPPPFRRALRDGGGTVDLDDDYRGAETWRARAVPGPDGQPVLIAIPMDDSEDALELLGGILWTTAAAVLAVTLAIGWIAGGLAQRRLTRISATLDQLAAGDLQARTGTVRATDDLDVLAQKLDTTANALERLVTQTRTLSASLAHDLRTPLARLRARLESLPDGPERGAALAEAGHLSDVFDAILRVARIEATQGAAGLEPVDLHALAHELFEIFEPVVDDAGKSLRLKAEAAETVQADRQMVIQAMANLIQNALVHGGPEITIHARGADIGVSDTGPGVDPDHYDDILKPMVRLDPARGSDGTGLGLALVRAVADRHRADLTLSPVSPQGLNVSLRFTDL